MGEVLPLLLRTSRGWALQRSLGSTRAPVGAMQAAHPPHQQPGSAHTSTGGNKQLQRGVGTKEGAGPCGSAPSPPQDGALGQRVSTEIN